MNLLCRVDRDPAVVFSIYYYVSPGYYCIITEGAGPAYHGPSDSTDTLVGMFAGVFIIGNCFVISLDLLPHNCHNPSPSPKSNSKVQSPSQEFKSKVLKSKSKSRQIDSSKGQTLRLKLKIKNSVNSIQDCDKVESNSSQ